MLGDILYNRKESVCSGSDTTTILFWGGRLLNQSQRHKELADFLKTRRLRLTPQAVGLSPQSTRRRTPGLRREEVAALSGVSLAWYTYLEQGRPIRVSEQVLESLARTLQLDNDERNYLFTLANQWLSIEPTVLKEETISPSLQQVLDELNYPAYIVGSMLNVIAWNQLACEVFGDFFKMDHWERNLVWRMFTDSDYRLLFVDWESMAKNLLAQLRIYYGKNIENPWYSELVDTLKKASPEFSEWWQQYDVFGIPEGKKVLRHPRVGLLVLEYNSLIVAAHPECILTVFTPDAGTDTQEKLKTLIRQ
jgi:transcriptional regulator with XRE-family HTH domain